MRKAKSLLLLLIIAFSLLPSVSVSPFKPALAVNAKTEGWVNRYVYEIDYGNGTHKIVSHIGPQVFWNNETNEWQELRFLYDETKKYYLLQNAHMSLRAYVDKPSSYFDPDNQRLCVEKEIITVEYEEKGKWKTVDLKNPVFTVVKNETSEVKLTKTLSGTNGVLNITYILKPALFLKHEITFTSNIAGNHTFRVHFKLEGIPSLKVKSPKGEKVINGTESVGKVPYFMFGENNTNLVLTEYLWSLGVTNEITGEWNATILQDVILDVEEGKGKADVIIGNYTLAQNDILLIDPLTSTWKEPTGMDNYWRGTWYENLHSKESFVKMVGGIPEFTLNRWKETRFALKWNSSYGTPSLSYVSNRISFETSNFTIKYYGLSKQSHQNEMGGTEIEFVIKSNLNVNKITFPIETDNLKFYYQPPLYEEYGFSEPFSNSTFFVNATHVMRLINGTWVNEAYRPENVVGSYAVYHATKTPFHRSKEEAEKYRAGKAFHIYRPKAVDSAGNEVWCDLNVDEAKGLLTITIPQEFLDNAVYPVIIDPTFGYEAAGGSYSALNSNCLYGFRPFACSESGTATSISWYGLFWMGGNAKCALYKDSDDSLVGYTEEKSIGTSPQWWTHNIVSGGTLTATDYILTVWANDAWVMFYDSVSGYNAAYRELTYDGFPDPAGWDSKQGYPDQKFSIYCTYTAAAGDTTPPTYSDVGANTTQAGQPCLFYCLWTDDTGLSGFIFSWNASGSWQNDTWTSLTTSAWANVTKTLPSSHVVVGYRWYCNDTSNNWNSTPIQTLTVTLLVSRQASDSQSSSAIVTSNLSFQRFLTAFQSATEKLTRILSTSRILTALTSLTESLSKTAQISRALLDSSTFFEQLLRTASYRKTLTAFATFTETVARTCTFERVLSEQAALTATLSKLGATFHRSISQTQYALAQLAPFRTFQRSLIDTILCAGQTLRFVSLTMHLSDGFYAAESISRTVQLGRVISDYETLIEHLTRTAFIQKGIKDSAISAIALSKTATFYRWLSDYPLLTEALARTCIFKRTLTEHTVLMESLFKLGAIYQVGLTDFTSLAEAITRTALSSRQITAVSTFLDRLQRTVFQTKTLTDYANIIEYLTRTVAMQKALKDSAVSAVSMLRTATFSRLLSEHSLHLTLITRTLQLKRTLSSYTVCLEQLFIIGQIYRFSLSDYITNLEQLTRTATFNRQLTATITLFTSIFKRTPHLTIRLYDAINLKVFLGLFYTPAVTPPPPPVPTPILPPKIPLTMDITSYTLVGVWNTYVKITLILIRGGNQDVKVQLKIDDKPYETQTIHVPLGPSRVDVDFSIDPLIIGYHKITVIATPESGSPAVREYPIFILPGWVITLIICVGTVFIVRYYVKLLKRKRF